MGFNCGIIGLPNAGKSTIFNALTSAGAHVASYPFTTIERNTGVVSVPDVRLDRLHEIFRSREVTTTTLGFTDIAGLVKGASRGEGLGNMFLGNIRDVDALIHVVRCFKESDIAHVYGSIDPRRDIEIINTELALADIETIEKRLQRLEKRKKTGEKGIDKEIDILTDIKDHLSRGIFPRAMEMGDEEKKILRDLHLLTAKPVLYVANVDEEEMMEGNAHIDEIKKIAMEDGSEVITICGKIEDELSTLSPEEHREYLEEFGLSEPGLHKLIRAGYRLLNLITFFTGNEREVKAWTVTSGTRAPQAAGKIHSDMEKGFIRAEVISFSELDSAGSIHTAREKGLIRIEGKEYVVMEGDVIYFRFHV